MAVMERLHQTVGAEGLQIPLPIMRRYGLKRGAAVVLNLHIDGIRILPATPGQETIGNLALRYLLTHLGDAVTIETKRNDGDWRVSVYGVGTADPVGELVYSPTGELLADRSTPVEKMQRCAAMAVEDT